MKKGLFKTIIFVLLLSLSGCNNNTDTNNSINTSTNTDTSIISITSEDVVSSNGDNISSIHTHKPSEIIIENKIEATCLDEGSYDEVIYCLDCNKELSREHKTISALGHNYSDWQIIKEASDIQDGLRERECTRCHDKQEEIIENTSPFTFSLSVDKKSYRVNSYKSTYQGEMIVVPDTFNDLPIEDISLTINRKEPSLEHVKVSIPKTIETFNGVTIEFNGLVEENGLSFDPVDIYFRGTLEDFLKVKIASNFAFSLNSPHYLYLYNQDTNDYQLLNKLILPNGLKKIENCQFANFQFEELTCPTSLEEIGSSAFIYNHSLKKVLLNEGLKKIGANAFSSTGIEKITIPSSIVDENTSYSWFYDCDYLFEITIKEGAQIASKSIGSNNTFVLLDYTDIKHTTVFNEDTITKDLIDKYEIFKYQDFYFLKKIDEYYLIRYSGSAIDVTLPKTIAYKGITVSSYKIMKNALLNSFLFTGTRNPSIEHAIKGIGFSGRPIQKLTFSKNILGFNSSIMNPWIEDIYFDGTYNELIAVLKNSPLENNKSILLSKSWSFSSQARFSANNMIHYKNESDEYVECDLNNLVIE